MLRPAGKEALVWLLVVWCGAVIQSTTAEAQKDDLNYDPEYNSNGIMAELDVSRLVPAPSTKKWSYDDHQDDENYLVLPAQAATRRSDIDDDDDDERDEAKSGSSQHGSYSESPAYGESAKAAQDGDDIENFFDTHLGPQDAAEASERDESSDQVTNGRTKLVDPDDQYDTAASSPLSEIFHSLLKVHRRPIVITTTEKTAPTSQAATAAAASSLSASGRPVASSTVLEPSSSGSSATSLAGIPFVPGSPFLDQSHQFSGQSSNSFGSSSSPSSHHDDSGNLVREVYIARRPSLFSPFTAKVVEQQQQPPALPEPPFHHFQSNQWRGIPTGGSDSRDPEDRQPVSASYNSYSTGQHYGSGSPSNDDQTVSYGLSFGSSSGSTGSGLFPSLLASLGGGSSSSSGSNNEQSSPTSSFNPGYNSMANSMRQPVSAPVGYQNNYRQPYYQSSNQVYGQKYNPYTQQQNQMMTGNGGQQYNTMDSAAFARNHQFASAGTGSYGRNRGGIQAADESMDAKNWIIRQHLLAKVDQQLKNNPYYKQNLAQASQQLPITDMRAFQQQQQQQSNRGSQVVDTNTAMFNSMHSVSDPYSTFTTASSLMSEPQTENSLRKGVSVNPTGSSTEISSTRLIPTHQSISQTVLSKCEEAARAAQQLAAATQATQMNSLVPQHHHQQNNIQPKNDLLRNKPSPIDTTSTSKPLIRVRREDADDRENDDVDDDGVWVDDEEDDDNKQTASDINETSQEPRDQDSQDNQQEQGDSSTYHVSAPAGHIGRPHGYEIAL